MMQRLADLQARIRSLRELGDVVGAMRSLSAVRVQQARETLFAIRQYTRVIEDALAEVAPAMAAAGSPSPPEEKGPAAVVAFGSEHGFVGAFNDRVLERAVLHLSTPHDHLIIVGARAAVIAAERHHPVELSFPMAAHIGGIDDVALRLADKLAEIAVARVVLVYTRSSGGATWRIVAETLLPFDLAPYLLNRMNRMLPVSNLEMESLFADLVGELVFSRLAHATAESYASESAARLSTMQSARSNIEDKLADLARSEREGRQEEITSELLDIVVGAEAMR